MRKIKLQTGEYYHIYNRGVDKRDVFLDNHDFIRFLVGMKEFNNEEAVGSLHQLNCKRKREQFEEGAKALKAFRALAPSSTLVEIICYCLNKNHYHFILKQVKETGISTFMSKISSGYTSYFNCKNNRSGSLFQGPFKSAHIESESQLLYTSAYIHGNPEIHGISDAKKWPWSSYQDYLDLRDGNMCNKNTTLKHFKNIKDYKNYVKDVIKNTSQIKKDEKKYLFE